jgi:hypothetical protein
MPFDLLKTVEKKLEYQRTVEWAKQMDWLLTALKRHGIDWKGCPKPSTWDEEKRAMVGGGLWPAPEIPAALEQALIIAGDGKLREGLRWLANGHPFFYRGVDWPFNSDPQNVQRDMSAKLRALWESARADGLAASV